MPDAVFGETLIVANLRPQSINVKTRILLVQIQTPAVNDYSYFTVLTINPLGGSDGHFNFSTLLQHNTIILFIDLEYFYPVVTLSFTLQYTSL